MKAEDEFYEVLGRLSEWDALKHLVLVGSWAMRVYEENFGGASSTLVTRDIDFLVKRPRGPYPPETPNLREVLQEQGYRALVSPVDQNEGYIPDKTMGDRELRIEFICQPGRHVQGAHRIKDLGITAQSLQYQSVLLDHAVKRSYRGIVVDVPEPEVWVIHKIAISRLRSGAEREYKSRNDLNVALRVMDMVGVDKVLARAGEFKGKFKSLFEEGWRWVDLEDRPGTGQEKTSRID